MEILGDDAAGCFPGVFEHALDERRGFADARGEAAHEGHRVVVDAQDGFETARERERGAELR